MDVNQTRLHVVLGREDWGRWLPSPEPAGHTLRECWETSPPGTVACDLHWESDRNELTLRPKPFHFSASSGDRKPSLGSPHNYATSARRGAARDRFGNWYYLSKNRQAILVVSVGCKDTAPFWSCDEKQISEPMVHGMFKAAETPPPPPPPGTLSGLTVTEDHYLVVGTLGSKGRGGLLIFDLHAGGPPRHLDWPEGLDFEPFDMSPRRHGGVWILDRANRCYWALDRHMRVEAKEQTEKHLGGGELDAFQPAEGTQTHSTPARIFPEGIPLDAASPIEAMDPVSIEGLPDGTVLILDAVSEATPSVLWHYDFSERLSRTVLDHPITAPLEEHEPGTFFRPAYDFAFLPANQSTTPAKSCTCGNRPSAPPTDSNDPETIGDLFVVTGEGNQTVRFQLRREGEHLQLARASPDFHPMRLFSGMGLVTAGERVFYDSNGRWVPLVKQDRPLYVEEAVIVSRELDGREPGCVWHRLMLDGCSPPDTAVEVSSRASDEKDELEFAEWKSEPAFYRRSDGSELPFTARPKSKDSGTYELLFEKARGRYLQLKLTLSGNGRSSPRLRALRIYYPRFSYLDNYLPAVYRQDSESASFLDRFLANLEGTNTALEGKIAAVQMLFDVRSAPADTLDWLANWFGIALDPAWDEPRQRLLIRHAMSFFQWRGTIRGLQMALHLAFDEQVDDSVFDGPGKSCRCRQSKAKRAHSRKCRRGTDRFRVEEKFLLRPAPAIRFVEPSDDIGPHLVEKLGPWTPNKGRAELRRRYQDWRTGEGWVEFDLGVGKSSDESDALRAFAKRELGFEPSDVLEEREAWRNFRQSRHGNDVDNVLVPSDQPPPDSELLKDWRDYLSSDQPRPYEVKRRLWQDFLARRYSSVNALNQRHDTQWVNFDLISYPDSLPANRWLLWDWFQFESLVLPTHEAAHRFTVWLPFNGHTLPEVERRTDHLELARRLLELEKPAHTTFDVKFYWALFRVGEARLGLDTVLGLGGRDPALLPTALLGHTFLAETQLAATHPFDVTDRRIVGRDRLN